MTYLITSEWAADSPPGSAAPTPLLAGRSRSIHDNFRVAFQRELNPVGPIEQVLVDELARRATHMQMLDDAHRIMARQAEKATAIMLNATAAPENDSSELARACALANERTETIFRQGAAASKLFASALRAVERLQSAGLAGSNSEFLRPDPRFATEIACHTWLARRFVEGLVPCPRCGQRAGGSVLSARRTWECGSCKFQTGLRAGTVMQASSLPLVAWFQSIRVLLLRPATSPAELAQWIQIKRVQTVSQMKGKIIKAINAETPSSLLAGLDELY